MTRTRTRRHPSTAQVISEENREHNKIMAELNRLAEQVLSGRMTPEIAAKLYSEVDDIYASVVRDLGIVPDGLVDTSAAA